MKKLLLCLTGIFALLKMSAQCPVTTIPAGDNGNGVCYLDAVSVDANIINTGTGFSAPTPSYQSFTAPYVMLKQGMMSSFGIDFNNSTTATICAWIDYDQDGFYSSTEIAFYIPGLSGPNVIANTTPPTNIAPDTLRMRITLQQGVPGWGPGSNDACLAPGYGEVEDYLVILQCADPVPLSFDPFPTICLQDSVPLFAFGSYDVAWYAGSPATMIGQGNNINFHTNPGCTDTIVYVQSVTEGCYSNPFEQMDITFDPSPLANIIGPDTIRSCSTVTVNATPGPYTYFWNAGGTDSSITFTSGFGGDLILTTTFPNGCSSQDRIYVNIATDPPSSYANAVIGSSFCSNLEILLMYDSIIAPGTCTWYTYPANTLIGSGQAFFYNLPDTGVYQFQAVINSVCGMDTALVTVNGFTHIEYDSAYVVGATLGANNVYTFCYGNSGSITTIIAGLQGTVSSWDITDETLGFTMPWNDDDTLDLPANMATVGHLYSVQAWVTNAQGCTDTTTRVYLTPANTINFNISDSAWQCSFPVTLGDNSASYATYDFLWSTGDTTNTITLNAPGDITLYAIDHVTGCVTNDTAYVGDASAQANLFGDTTYICNGTAYFDPSLVQYSTDYWEEFDIAWNQINGSSDPDYYAVSNSDGYIVFHGYNSHGCYINDTTFVTYNLNFTFSLGPDITTAVTPVTLTGPSGYGLFSYTWAPVSGSNQSIQVSTSGTYSLTVINGYGCAYTDVIVVNILPMDMLDFTEVSVSVFPNPATNKVNVASAEMIRTVNIYDLNGSLISSEQISATQAEVNISELPDGCYILEAVTENGNSRSRIVKQQ
jgi:hypothetical protein